jgi:hypothetical protein
MLSVLLLNLVILAAPVNSAFSKALESDYFVGRWTPDGEAGCNDPNSAFMDLDDQGIIQIRRLGKLESVGLWEFKDELLYAHLLALPSFFTDRIQEPVDQLGYYVVKVLLFNVAENEFDAAVSHEEFLKRAEYSRCVP